MTTATVYFRGEVVSSWTHYLECFVETFLLKRAFGRVAVFEQEIYSHGYS